jgi:GTP-binding protein
MLPVIVLVGRPNVGKSTLFNRLTRTRDALVADLPGLTRDRQYGVGRVGPRPYVVVDTGGIAGAADGVAALMERQVQHAIAEADAILFLVDARDGRTAADESIAAELRRTGRTVRLVVNKSEHLERTTASAEFFALGLGEPVPISAAHGRGVKPLMDEVLGAFPPAEEPAPEAGDQGVMVAVVGRPNVGKSTLVNRLIGEDRLVVFDEPGTTRDSIQVPFERDGRRYTLIDTAGVRRRARIEEAVEKFSVIKTLQAIEAANVVLFLLDGQAGITEQDASLAGHVVESGRSMVVVVNKWDGLEPDQRERVKSELDRRLGFLDFAERRFVSALHGSGVGNLLAAVDTAYDSAVRDLRTPLLTRILEEAVQAHQPPLVHGRRIKLRYAHQGGRNPPLIVVHGNQTEHVPAGYRRYLEQRFATALRLRGTPVRVEFRSGSNPFEGRKNPLTPRQVRKRQRLVKFVKGRD